MRAGAIHVFFVEAGRSDIAGSRRPTFPLQKKGPVGIIAVLYFGGFSEE
jgi:hypothetical protein